MWILLKHVTVSGSGISSAVCKSAPRSRQITTPAPHHSVFLQAGCPSCRPTNSVKALKASYPPKLDVDYIAGGTSRSGRIVSPVLVESTAAEQRSTTSLKWRFRLHTYGSVASSRGNSIYSVSSANLRPLLRRASDILLSRILRHESTENSISRRHLLQQLHYCPPAT